MGSLKYNAGLLNGIELRSEYWEKDNGRSCNGGGNEVYYFFKEVNVHAALLKSHKPNA